MKKLVVITSIIIILVVVVFYALAQNEPTEMPYIDPNMIEISYNAGETWADATVLVSDLAITEGVATTIHIDRARRGSIIIWEGQLGTPEETKKLTFRLDTSKIPQSENKFYIHWKFGMLYAAADGTAETDESPFAEISDEVKLIGKPDKAVNTGTAP